MFARNKPARPAEMSAPTDAPDAANAAASPETSAPTPTPDAAVDQAATPAPEPAPAPAVAFSAHSARPAAPAPAAPAAPAAQASRSKAVSMLAGDLSFEGTLTGDGDVHVGGPFKGDIRVRDVTVGVSGRVEGVITGRRIEVLGRVTGGLVADEVRVRNSAEVEADVTSQSFAVEATARFEGHSKRKSR